MSEFREFSQRIIQFLDTDGSNIEKLAYDLTQSKLTNEQIMSLLWSFLSLSKTDSLFNENSHELICTILYEIAKINSNFANLLLLTLDMPDLAKINLDSSLFDNDSFYKSKKFYNSRKFKITKYQYMETNPEGFSRLFLALMKNRSDDLVQIIGEHNLDPDSVLLILIDLIGYKNAESTKKFYDMLSQFNVNRTINMLIQKIDQDYMPGHIQILFHLFDSGMIPEQRQIPILSHLSSVLDKLRSILSNEADILCEELRKPRTIFPGEDKYSDTCQRMQKSYGEAHSILYQSPHFKIEFQEINIDKIFKYAQYDPCSVPALAEYVTNFLIESIIADPENFFKNDINMQLISILNCHCTSNRLIVLICRLEYIPAHVFINFLFPSMSMSKVGWQLSEIIFAKLSSLYNFSQRCQIYRRFQEVYETIIDLRILSAKVKGRIGNIMKRITLTGDTKNERKGNVFSYKVSKLFIKAPHVVSNAFITYIRDNDPTPKPEVLVGVLYESSRFIIDIVLWKFIDTIMNVKNETKEETISLDPSMTNWPDYIGKFLGQLADLNFFSFDIEGYLNFIIYQFRQHKVGSACLLTNLLYQITGIQFTDQMEDDAIELKSAEGLPRVIRSLESTKDLQVIQRFKNVLINENNKFAIRILYYLDSMHSTLNFIDFLQDKSQAAIRLDAIQSAFLSLCEFMESNDWNPKELVEKYHFTFPSAFHISRGNGNKNYQVILNENGETMYNDIQSLMPIQMPVDLFTCFWQYGLKDLHFPEEIFKKKLIFIDKEIKAATEENKTNYELIKMNVQANMDNQKEKIPILEENFRRISQDWFNEEVNEKVYQKLVQVCIIKRILISQIDAIYSAKFIFLLAHTSKSFCLKTFILEFLRAFHFIIFSATVVESNSFGIFIRYILKYIRKRDIEESIHEVLMEKINLLLDRNETSFTIANTINMMNMFIKYFPRRTQHKKNILKKLEQVKLNEEKTLLESYTLRIEKSLTNNKRSRSPSPQPRKSPPPQPRNVKQTKQATNDDVKTKSTKDEKSNETKEEEKKEIIIEDKKEEEEMKEKESGLNDKEEEEEEAKDDRDDGNNETNDDNDDHVNEDTRSNDNDENNEEEQINDDVRSNEEGQEAEIKDDDTNSNANEEIAKEEEKEKSDNTQEMDDKDQKEKIEKEKSKDDKEKSKDDREKSKDSKEKAKDDKEKSKDDKKRDKNDQSQDKKVSTKEKVTTNNEKKDSLKQTPQRTVMKSGTSPHQGMRNDRDRSDRNMRNDRDRTNVRSDRTDGTNRDRNDRDRNSRVDNRDRNERIDRDRNIRNDRIERSSSRNDRDRMDRNDSRNDRDRMDRNDSRNDRDRMDRNDNKYQQQRLRNPNDRYQSQGRPNDNDYYYGNRNAQYMDKRQYNDIRRMKNDK
ncbi:hypothetical protein M9Y10_013064 [Tritrichomonas musculus]|uniref:THO complex subunitTHOC2 C-terminal domain-containing protein n=1 Tax=Tritrichomonas musculus TaxID=1915356 RepID=A0ABR2I7N7_9EUKA